jgi:ankyrin repeat protein
MNKFRETPLHKAMLNAHIKVMIVNLLLKNGADVNKQNEWNETGIVLLPSID